MSVFSGLECWLIEFGISLPFGLFQEASVYIDLFEIPLGGEFRSPGPDNQICLSVRSLLFSPLGK